MINHETNKNNMNKIIMDIAVSGIDIEEHIIESENIYTSGFIMEKTYPSNNRGN